MIDPKHPTLSVKRQCQLVSISRSCFYGGRQGESPLNLTLMRLIDEQFMETPFYGSRQMARHLKRQGYDVGRKRVRRLMARMGLQAIYQKPRTTVRYPEHRTYPYLLRGLCIDRPNQVWCADITYSAPRAALAARHMFRMRLKGGNGITPTIRCRMVRAQAAVTCC
jgi:putative transposase